MSSLAFSILFVSFFILSLVLRFWLSSRQLRHVMAHRGAVPADFAEKIPLSAHQKAADYTAAKIHFGLLSLLFSSAVLIGFTLLGGLQWLAIALLPHTGNGIAFQIGLFVAFAAVSGVLDLPFDYYRQFVLEQRFGFNKMRLRLWITDTLTMTGLTLAFGVPLIWVVLLLMEKSGDLWWLYTWMVVIGFMWLMMIISPTVIMPLFNKFEPLTDASLRQRIEGLMTRVNFASKGLFVMDGSKRSSHSNAYFTGFGPAKRVVFYDTLVANLTEPEIEAVLAHELGHFKLRHTRKRTMMMSVFLLAFLALLGYLKSQTWFYSGLGFDPMPGVPNDAVALLLFMLVLPVFTFLFSPLTSISSRKHEFEADAFAATHTDARDLISALVKMYEENASTLTPDRLHSTFYDSHPPASIRIHQLNLAVR
ncbi:M48 family metallopeptidase [Massilia sp. CCM 9210]|uniref:M48 family metallopeptidase n=1 Tax=Massilia scottii TaxID=3057166 RepID=UPI00279662A5|nr:M48 family metallopeptidase [Massilia sp. CCM 9210]MDQ1815141.1 M48 family metallopeptidase [Massilia sp. CCM 9210]